MMLEQLKKILGPDWELEEVEKKMNHFQLICRHPKGTYLSPWYTELSVANVTYIGLMCNWLIKEPAIDYLEIEV